MSNIGLQDMRLNTHGINKFIMFIIIKNMTEVDKSNVDFFILYSVQENLFPTNKIIAHFIHNSSPRLYTRARTLCKEHGE
jgi:hypothetical protein